MSDSNPASNFIVVLHGRGALYACLARGTLAEVAELCQEECNMGFEVHIYSLKATTSGRPSTVVQGLTPLQQEWQLWDAEEEFKDLTNSIINHCDEHTLAGSKRYLEQCIRQLQEQLGLVHEEMGASSAPKDVSPPKDGLTDNPPKDARIEPGLQPLSEPIDEPQAG